MLFKPCQYPPDHPSLLEHSRRVGAVAQCIAHQLFVKTEAKALVAHAARLHHVPMETFGKGADATPELIELLREFHLPNDAPPEVKLLSEILHCADEYDELYQRRPAKAHSRAETIGELGCLAQRASRSHGPVDALERVMQETAFKALDMARLPVFPKAGYRALQLLEQSDCSIAQVGKIVASDPVIAGDVIRAANSALFKGHHDISTISKAVARLGYRTTRKIIYVAAVRPLFARPSMQPLLQHSVAVADLAHHLAAKTLAIDPEEAFLCGLVHDIGNLLMDQLNLFDSARARGLMEHGCPPVYAENLLFGCDHGNVGGDITAAWRFPARLVDAIRHHHEPELAASPLAHILYLAESQVAPAENLFSEVRADLCLRSTGLTSIGLEPNLDIESLSLIA